MHDEEFFILSYNMASYLHPVTDYAIVCSRDPVEIEDEQNINKQLVDNMEQRLLSWFRNTITYSME